MLSRMISRRMPPRFHAILAAAALSCLAPTVVAAPDNRSDLMAGFEGAPIPEGTEVRRFEWVLIVRTFAEFPDALGRAQIAAGKAGGAVLASMRWQGDAQHTDWRLLVRTVDRESIQDVLSAVRHISGVAGASSAALPETPTWAGSPGFLESYQAESGLPELSNAGRVLVRHDVPPVANASELLEMSDIAVGPGLPDLEHLGGFTLNVSEWAQRLKSSSWRNREDKMRNASLNILPPDGSPEAAAVPPSPEK